MCVASAVTDYYRDKWTTPNNDWTALPYQPYVPTPAGRWITEQQWQEYQDLKRIAEQYDERTGQPHCAKPDIAAWEAVIEDVLIKRGLLVKPAQD